MTIFYGAVGAVAGFFVFGFFGAVFGAAYGLLYSELLSTGKQVRKLEEKVLKLEFQLNDETAKRK